jgi:Fur family iron response transcriptional regulator
MASSAIIEKLVQHGVTPTPQRLEVAEILLCRPQHMSADQIIDQLKDCSSGVSKATVYNTLRLFSETGLIKELNVDPIRTFYDSTTHAHHHFYHVDSGELCDIPDDQISISGLPPLPEGTEQESVEVLIRIRNKNSQ